MSRVPLFWAWVDSECARIHSDGCSKVSGAYRRRCKVHDLSYYYAKDPMHAYGLYISGEPDYWLKANPITKAAADAEFRRGIQADSPGGFFSPVALWRWLGVKFGAQSAWDSHRQREAASA